MSLTVADLLEPKGKIAVHLFPGESAAALQARVTEYLTQATDRAAAHGLTAPTADDYARAWVYHLAFDAVATRMMATPSSASRNDQGSMQFLATQLLEMRTLSDRYRTEADALLVPVPDSTLPPRRWTSTAVAVSPVW